MELSFLLYILCILAIFATIGLYVLRNKSIWDYRDNYLTDGSQPPKYIPKKIFQLIADKNKISPEFQKNINYIKNLNPDWEYHLYDDNEMVSYIKENYGEEMLRYYNKINPKYGAAKADLFRYLLMYLEGGVYLDIKSASTIPLSEIILPDDEYLLSYWDLPIQSKLTGNKMGEYQQWHIICRPRHPFLYEVIQQVIKNIDNYDADSIGVGKLAVLKVTGPIAYTKTIKPIIDKYNHRIVELNEFVGLKYNNIGVSHKGLFSNKHYSHITDPVIIK